MTLWGYMIYLGKIEAYFSILISCCELLIRLLQTMSTATATTATTATSNSIVINSYVVSKVISEGTSITPIYLVEKQGRDYSKIPRVTTGSKKTDDAILRGLMNGLFQYDDVQVLVNLRNRL